VSWVLAAQRNAAKLLENDCGGLMRNFVSRRLWILPAAAACLLGSQALSVSAAWAQDDAEAAEESPAEVATAINASEGVAGLSQSEVAKVTRDELKSSGIADRVDRLTTYTTILLVIAVLLLLAVLALLMMLSRLAQRLRAAPPAVAAPRTGPSLSDAEERLYGSKAAP
jgi:hypothetical protein